MTDEQNTVYIMLKKSLGSTPLGMSTPAQLCYLQQEEIYAGKCFI